MRTVSAIPLPYRFPYRTRGSETERMYGDPGTDHIVFFRCHDGVRHIGHLEELPLNLLPPLNSALAVSFL
jgi:hypothetical protein